MMRTRFFTLAGFGISVVTLTLTGCGKKQPEAALAPAGQPATAPATPEAKKASFTDHAAKLGFAAHLPKETEMYLGSVNLKAQLDAAKKTAFWKDASAFIDDKTPAPGKAADPSSDAFKKLWGDDFFFALAKGSSQTLNTIREFSELYTEITYRAMMAGGPLAGGAPAAGTTEAPAGEDPRRTLRLK